MTFAFKQIKMRFFFTNTSIFTFFYFIKWKFYNWFQIFFYKCSLYHNLLLGFKTTTNFRVWFYIFIRNNNGCSVWVTDRSQRFNFIGFSLGGCLRKNCNCKNITFIWLAEFCPSFTDCKLYLFYHAILFRLFDWLFLFVYKFYIYICFLSNLMGNFWNVIKLH